MVRLTRTGSARFSGIGEERRKLLVALAIQQNCATLGRHHLKNQFQDLLLQTVQVRNGVHHAADFQQCIEIPSQPRSCRQLFQDAFRLKIENILGADVDRGLGQAIVELYSFGGGSIRVLFRQEYKNRFSHRDLIAVVQPLFRHHPTVNEGAITALEIAKLVTVIFPGEHAVASRQGKIADRQ